MDKLGTLIGLYALFMGLGGIYDPQSYRPQKKHDEEKGELPAAKEYYLKKAAEKRRRKIERMIKSHLTQEIPGPGAVKNPI